MSEHLLTILTQFTGGAKPEDHFVRLGLAAFFWLSLIWLAVHQRQYEAGTKKMLITGFALGFARETVMFIVFFLNVTGLVSHETLHPYYPPLEHLLSGVNVVWIMAAYLGYLKSRRSGDVLLAVGLTTSSIVFMTTFPGWFIFNSAHPATTFSQTWFDVAWHVNGVLLIGSAMFMTLRITGWPRVALFAALSCFFLDDVLMLFNIASGEAFASVYNPMRHALHIGAIPIFGYVFMREQWERQELSEAELHHGKRELRSFAETLEHQVLKRTVELEVSAMRLQQAEELAHLGHWSYVREDDCFLCSEEALNVFELPVNQRGINLNMLKSYYFPDDRESLERMFGALLEHGTAYDVTRQICLPDGRVKYVHIKCRPGDTPDLDAVGTLQDVTLQVMLEKAMQEREAELIDARHVAEEANRAKSVFLATMSHEIRTPLNAMIGNLTLMNSTSLGEEQSQYVRNCTSASQTLLRVINDILDFSKIEAGKMELVRESYSPRIMLDSIVSIFTCRAEEKQLRLNMEIVGQLPDFILGDRQRLGQTISNILSNAIKFTKQGGVTLTASAKTAGNGEVLLVVDVSDSGIGIPAEQQSVIFDSFTQLDNFSTRRQGGSGLGLAICRRLVEKMGGDIALSSTPGEGSTFTVTVPVIPCEAPLVKTKSQQVDKLTPRKVLLADDDELGRMVVTTLLERKGHQVTAVENGARLLEVLQCDTFDILITDISMPDMEGTEVARIIRLGERKDINRLIPIIALTAHAFIQDRERFLDSGINGYISKPFNFEKLLELIEDVCGTCAVVPKSTNSDCLQTVEADVSIPY